MSARLHTKAKIAPPSFTPARSRLLGRRSGSEHHTVPPIVHDVLRSPGKPLDAQSREYFDPRFGHDFSQIRIHSDEQAAESARTVNAHAYTVGRDVVFGAGQYRPTTTAGRRLLA